MPETITPVAPTITDLFTRAVAAWPDEVAFRVYRDSEWQGITFGEYGEAVRDCAGGLIALGFEAGDFGALASANRPEWHEADFGMINAGLVSCPVYPTSSPAQIHYILEHSESRVIFVEDETQRAKVDEIRKDLTNLATCVVFTGEGCDGGFYIAWDDLLTRGRELLSTDAEGYEQRRNAAQPGDLLAVIYTSGTTGPPKGTMLSHHNAVWTLASLHTIAEAGPGDRKLSFLPLSHVAERTASEYLQLYQGFEIWFARSADTIAEDLPACRPTWQFVVPRVLEKQYEGVMRMLDGLDDEQRDRAMQAVELGKQRVRLAQEGQSLPAEQEAAYQQANEQLFARARAALGYDQVKQLVSGAAPISLELLEFFHAIGVPLVEVYGQTEDHGPTAISRIEDNKLGTVGYAMPGGEVRLAEDGEICYRGDNVCMGYYKNPEATAELIDDDGWMYSGDIGVIDEDGHLKVTDRKKDIIVTAQGKNIAPQEIEQQLKFSPWVSQAVVIGDGRRYVTALITLDEQAVTGFAEQKSIPYTDFAELTQHPDIVGLIEAHVGQVNESLSHAEQVKRFRILPEDFTVEAGTITPTMKIKRKPVHDRYADEIEAIYTDEPAAG
jgi:long-chain acyl-CoA synthetase